MHGIHCPMKCYLQCPYNNSKQTSIHIIPQLNSIILTHTKIIDIVLPCWSHVYGIRVTAHIADVVNQIPYCRDLIHPNIVLTNPRPLSGYPISDDVFYLIGIIIQWKSSLFNNNLVFNFIFHPSIPDCINHAKIYDTYAKYSCNLLQVAYFIQLII